MKKIIAFLFLFQISFGQINPEEVATAENEFETNFFDALKEKAIEKEFKALNRKSKKSKDFIIKSSKIHNNKYNYDLVLYENCRTKVKIECQVHGVFEQTPDAHQYSERGCEKCAREARRKTQINEQSD
jgi:hypothetical protein